MPASLTFSDPFAPVELQAISVAGETVPTRVAVRVRTDEGAFSVQGLVGRDYQLLPNRKVRDIADDIMSRAVGLSDLGGFRNLKTLFDGKRYVDFFASNNPIARMNGSNSELKLGLMAWNAYDGTRKTGFEVFALNPYCTNQYHSRNRFGFFAWKHTPGEAGRIDIDDALTSISAGVQNIIRVAPMIGELKRRELTPKLLLEAKAGTEIPQTRWGDILDQLGAEEPNAFGLFQAMTNITSHKLNGLSAINAGSSVTEFFLAGDARPVMSHTAAADVMASGERNGDVAVTART